MEIKKIDFKWSNNYSIFASDKFLKSQSNNFGWLGGFIQNDLKFILPYVIKKKLIFNYIVFQTGAIYIDENQTLNEEQHFLENIVVFLKSEKIDFIAHPSSYTLFNTYPLKSVCGPFGTFILNLELPEDELFAGMHQKHRNVVRNAIKNNVIIKHGKEYSDLAYEMVIKTLDRSNMSFSGKEYFENIINSLEGNMEIFVAFKDDAPQGCAVFLYSEFCAFYLWGGSCENPVLGSLNLLQWEAIKYFKSLGVKKYNFVGARLKPDEGSKLEGIQRFKARFGGELKTGYLWKMPLNKLKFYLFNVLIKIKNFGTNSGKDIIDQERKKIGK